MDKLPERALIAAERVNAIEVQLTLTAHAAPPAVIERIIIREWCSAGPASEFRDQRLGYCQTGPANGDTRGVSEGLFTDSALVWKDKVEQAIGSSTNARQKASSRLGVSC